jgi:hypothetical protein
MTLRILGLAVFLVPMCTVSACNSDSSNDGGIDATSEGPLDICGEFTGVGLSCPHLSTVICFPVCEAVGGCQCKSGEAGPTWECTTPPECFDPCGNTSPENDASCDASDGATFEDAGDAMADAPGSDATDAMADAADAATD